MHQHAADLATLILRLTLGLMLICHGLNKVFGGGKLPGTARWFESLGLKPGWLHARLAAGNELGAGSLMCLGLLTPLPVAGFVGLMTVAALTDHEGKGFFVFKGGWEYVAVVGAIATSLGIIGPGRWSLDHAAGIDLSGIGWGLGAAVVGVIAGIGMLVGFRRRTPAPTS